MNDLIQFFENEVAGNNANHRLATVIYILLFFGLLTTIMSIF
jgi:hypothetical protein